jgi:putative transposase
VNNAEVDTGKRPGASTDVTARMKALERENRELRQANEILRKSSVAFIDDHRAVYGVEPICNVLPIAPLDLP